MNQILPEIATVVRDGLQRAGHADLAEQVAELYLYAVAVDHGPIGLQFGASSGRRVGATVIQVDNAVVEVKRGRIVYIETDVAKPVRRMLRRLSPQFA